MATGRVTLQNENGRKRGFGIPWLKHIALLLLLIIYTFCGAYLMILLEKPTDTRKKQTEYESQYAKYETMQHQLKIIIYDYIKLQTVEESAFNWLIKKSNFSKPQLQATEWDLWEAIFYVTSLYTTVGYGNISPKTDGGRCFTMLYAILGIPLVLLILNDWGNLFFRLIRLFWNKICSIKFCSKTKVQDLNKIGMNDAKETKNVPLLLAAFICIAYMCICAAIFQIWEKEWNYFVAFYFFFISLTTIGLGDVIPKHVEYSVYAFILVFIGLAVVSMCLNVIQAKLDAIVKELASSIDRKYKEHLKNMEEEIESLKSLENDLTWKERLLYQMLNEEKKQLVKEKFEKRLKVLNKRVQTVYDSENLQTSIDVLTKVITQNTVETQTVYDSEDFGFGIQTSIDVSTKVTTQNTVETQTVCDHFFMQSEMTSGAIEFMNVYSVDSDEDGTYRWRTSN